MIKTPHGGEWGFGNLGHNRPGMLETQKILVIFAKKAILSSECCRAKMADSARRIALKQRSFTLTFTR